MRRSAGGRRRGRVPTCEALEDRRLLAVSLSFDYSLDRGGFFDASRRALLESTLNAISSKFTDSLASVREYSYTLDGGTVTTGSPANVIKVYAYGRSLSGSTAGQGGAYYSAGMRGQGANDFAPDITYMMFDDDGSTDWFFGETTAGITSSQLDFVTVARHEFLHSLGFIGQPSYTANIQGSLFVGANARAVNGGAGVPMSGGHIDASIPSVLNAMMMVGERRDLGELEWAMLKDIGWSVAASAAPTSDAEPLYADYGRNGLWSWTESGGWDQIDAGDRQGIAVAADGSLFIDRGQDGLWRWTESTGSIKINGANPQAMTPGADGSLFVDYGRFGLWRWTAGSGLKQINGADPRSFAAGASGELFVDYGRFGLWVWRAGSSMKQINTVGPDGMSVGPDGTLYIDYGRSGLWSYSAAGRWAKLHADDPQGIAAGPAGTLYVDFGQSGLWLWTATDGYRRLNSADPRSLVAGADGWLYIDFGPFGLWRWSTVGGLRKIRDDAPEQLAVRSPALKR